MQYDKLYIQNFRGIDEIELNDFKHINLFVGENNCGKTSILEALFLVTGISRPLLAITINQLRGINYSFGDDSEHLLLYHKLKYDNFINIKVEGDKIVRNLKITPHISTTQNVSSDNKKEDLSKLAYSSLSNNKLVDGYKYEVSILEKNKNINFVASVYPYGGLFKEEISTNYKETIVSTLINSTNILYQLPQNLNHLIKAKQIDKVVKVLQKIDHSIENIYAGTDNLIYCDIGLEQLIPINVMGDGIRRALSLIVSVANFSNGVIFIDEVENGFHFKSLEIMWKALIEASREFNVQIFATTHSIECVRELNNAYQESNNHEIRLFRIERSEGKLLTKSFSPSMLQLALENNWEMR